MTAEPPVDTADPNTIQWRRDATTSRTVRLLWSLGVGTFFAAISLIVFWRFFDLAGQAGQLLQSVIAALLAAIVVTILALAASSNTTGQLERLARPLPISTPSGPALERAMDAALGAVVMGVVIGGLMILGRIAARPELLGPGGESPFTGLAAATIPLALVALALASFLRSVGAFDREDATIYLYDPDQAIDLSVIEDVSVRRIGDVAVVTFEYAAPDGQYVAGPRRVVVPPEVATEIADIVGVR